MSMLPELLFIPPNRVWRTYPGGRTLDLHQGKTNPEDGQMAEDWICSTTRAVNKGREELENEGLSAVLIEKESVLLEDLITKYPEHTVGRQHFEHYGAVPQFLLKFLDSAIRLHIQCHPTVSFARKHLNSNSGKTEAYVILTSREEIEHPFIYLGFQQPPSREIFRADIQNQNLPGILSCFEKIPVRPGDVFIVPGGLPHAIGAGIFMIEIMEPTDFAIRLEFEKGGYVLPEEARFMGRGLDFALSMLNFEKFTIPQIRRRYFVEPRELSADQGGRETLLIAKEQTDCFCVKKLEVWGQRLQSEEPFYIAIVTRGGGTARCAEGEYPLKCWDRFMVPAGTDSVQYTSTEGMEMVLVFPPSYLTDGRGQRS